MEKTMACYIDMDTQNKLANKCIQNFGDVDVYEGCLLDNIVMYINNEKTNLGYTLYNDYGEVVYKGYGYKYIITLEEYLNGWSSIIKAIFTNDEKVLEELTEYLHHEDEEEV